LTQSGAVQRRPADSGACTGCGHAGDGRWRSAAVDTAKLNLSYATITARSQGAPAWKQVNEGALVHANDATGIVTITQIQPISVQFSLPQDDRRISWGGSKSAPLPVAIDTRDRLQTSGPTGADSHRQSGRYHDGMSN